LAAPEVTARVESSDRLLAPDELEQLVQALVREPEVWQPLVREDGDRVHELLHLDDRVGVWVVTWMPGHDTRYHDHQRSCGAVVVAEGTIREDRPRWGEDPRRIEPGAGESFSFDATEIHRMANLSGTRAVTIHAYSPPIQRMGLYTIDDDCSLRRRSIPWDETLDADTEV
jgi:predicted metal-dependent enzyme (double-stranded beta helix superfamily)